MWAVLVRLGLEKFPEGHAPQQGSLSPIVTMKTLRTVQLGKAAGSAGLHHWREWFSPF